MCAIMGYIGTQIRREEFMQGFDKTISRGPDMSEVLQVGEHGTLAFHRLAIMELTERGMQPFTLGDDAVVCNGEIYGFRPLR